MYGGRAAQKDKNYFYKISLMYFLAFLILVITLVNMNKAIGYYKKEKTDYDSVTVFEKLRAKSCLLIMDSGVHVGHLVETM